MEMICLSVLGYTVWWTFSSIINLIKDEEKNEIVKETEIDNKESDKSLKGD